jgi:hypothetical protein
MDRSEYTPIAEPKDKGELRSITPPEAREDGAQVLIYERSDGVEFRCLKYHSHEEWFELENP